MTTPAARLVDVSKTYHIGDIAVPALRGVSLDIDSGAFMSIAGPSGSGKTTVLNLLGALDTPNEGTVWIGEDNTSGLSRSRLADFRNAHLGFVFQTFNLIPVLTARENVELPLQLAGMTNKEERRTRVDEMLTEVGLSTMTERRPNELSGGQQQRVAIARALIKRPTIVLADEPTANLDSGTAEEIMSLMHRMNEKLGTTFVFSTHDPLVMSHASRLVLLRDGQIESDETVERSPHAA